MTSTLKIGILGCDDAPAHLRAIGGTYKEMFERLLKPHLPQAEFVWFDAVNGKLPESTDACDAYLCTGSRYSVYDDREWIHALKHYIRQVHDAKKPFVGVCFGHQVLAQALGGDVRPATEGWGVGILPMKVAASEAWMQPAQDDCKLQYMHGDQVQELPPDSVVLAAAPHCPVAMFRVGETMLGIEGHPEFPAAYVEALLHARRERIGAARTDAALASLDQTADDDVVARWMANFLTQRPQSR